MLQVLDRICGRGYSARVEAAGIAQLSVVTSSRLEALDYHLNDTL